MPQSLWFDSLVSQCPDGPMVVVQSLPADRGTLLPLHLLPHHGKGVGSVWESTAEPVCVAAVLGMVLIIHRGRLLLFVSISPASGLGVCLPLRPVIFIHSTSKYFNDLLLGCQIK